MAEVMLLLVFCLLIALASFLRTEQTKRMDLDKQLQLERSQNEHNRDFVTSLRKNPALSDRLRDLSGQGDKSAIDKFWRELVDSRAVTSELERNGVPLKEIRDRVMDASELRTKGIGLQKALDDAKIVAAINRHLESRGEPPVSPQTVSNILLSQKPEAQVGPSGHQWPPIISLSEANGNYFKTGSAELSAQFRETLTSKIPERIASYVKQFDVDLIEVVGHTDDQQFGARHRTADAQPTIVEIPRQSNLDRDLLSVLSGRGTVGGLVPADNAGLGLARAVSVVTVLRQSPLLKDYKLIPLSAAQLVNTDESLALSSSGDLPQRRRIEIRLRKSTVKEAEASRPPPPYRKLSKPSATRMPIVIAPAPKSYSTQPAAR
jgi:flagellar motor protein MotB